ncbi:hypothetical protein [Nocardia sputi]|uniref:hypothetical protein n=1 Tax=Nocardia sputi TaxID=2943705 RepID=UPI0020BE6FF9|nr:hypothetical protein [Nocardia sputi]
MATRLKTVLQQQHLQTHSAFCREYDKIAATIDPDLVGSAPKRSQFHRWLSGEVKGLPYPHHCRILEKMLPGHTATELFEPEITGRDIDESSTPGLNPAPSISWMPPRIQHQSPAGGARPIDSRELFGDRLPYLRMPPGRFFSGPDIPTVVFPATVDHGRVVGTAPLDPLSATALATPGRALVVARAGAPDHPGHYVMDRRRARARLAAAAPDAPLVFPHAYLLDDFTLALIWAVTSLDSALLDDDADLANTMGRMDPLDLDPYPDVGRDDSVELSPVSQMWVGSTVCARHIIRHTDTLTGTPQFWTREQRGEEASTWLLFTHKYHYLKATAQTQGERPTRAFCIPPDAVRASATPERILLLLATALHEAMGITTVVCTEPEYTATPGFVLDRAHRALVANWVNTDRIWHVEVTDDRPVLREFDDAVGWARTRTILPGRSPRHRLQALADYLDLDWSWLVHRATGLADSGVTGLCSPRSRLLSTAGLERACAFVSDLATDDR